MRRAGFSLLLFLGVVSGSRSIAMAADKPAISAQTQPSKTNRPPKIDVGVRVDPPISDRYGGDVFVRIGRVTRITFQAEDPDDDPLIYSVDPLPAGATFDTNEGILTWQPTAEQRGKHAIHFEVTDGRLRAKRAFVLTAVPNRAPEAGSDSVLFRVARDPATPSDAAGEIVLDEGATLLAHDPDGDSLTFKVRSQPAGARITAAGGSVSFTWTPTPAAVGEHELILDVSDGEFQATVRKKVVVVPAWAATDYKRWLLLGGGPSGFVTHGDGELFVGGTFDVSLVALREDAVSGYACAHGIRHYECHASHHRFYANFEVLDSMRPGAPSLFTYGAGYSASLEWNPERRYFIPHYGVDAGGLVRSGVGHRAQVHPYIGLHLWAGDQLWINLTLGYRVVPAELIDLSGPTIALQAVVNPW